MMKRAISLVTLGTSATIEDCIDITIRWRVGANKTIGYELYRPIVMELAYEKA